MRKRNHKKIIRYLLLTVSLFITTFLTGCMDLGVFVQEESFDLYYSSLGEVVGKYDQDGNVNNNNYDVEKSLFNDSTINHFTWEDEDDAVEYQKYAYIVIPFKADLNIESIALFIASEPGNTASVGLKLDFSAFYYPDSSLIPADEKIKLLSSPNTRTVIEKDENDNDVEREEVIEYDDLPQEYSVCSTSYEVTNVWEDGIVLEKFRQTVDYGISYVSDGKLTVKNGSYLYIRIENNSGMSNHSLEPCSISFMNLMIRAV